MVFLEGNMAYLVLAMFFLGFSILISPGKRLQAREERTQLGHFQEFCGGCEPFSYSLVVLPNELKPCSPCPRRGLCPHYR